MDIIRIRQLKLDVYLGVYDWEQENARPVFIDLELSVDLARAAKSDALADTVDYAALADEIRRRTSSSAAAAPRRYALIEKLAGDIADICLAFDTRVASAQVTVGKPGAVQGAETVEVEIIRTRQETHAEIH